MMNPAGFRISRVASNRFCQSPFLFCLLFIFHSTFGQEIRTSFKSHRVLRLNPKTDLHIELLKNITTKASFNDSHGVEFWSHPAKDAQVDVRVPPSHLDRVKRDLHAQRIPYRTLIPDLQRLIDDERRVFIQSSRLPKNLGGPSSIVGRYARFYQIMNWLREIANTHSDISSLIQLGYSSEQRPLMILKIGKPRADNSEKPAVWIDAGIHAREWIAPATLIYTIYKLLDEYKKGDGRTKSLVENFDWFLLPVANPDGYEYTWSTNRLWRKTRSKTPFSNCRGADPNRNWSFHWRESGASLNPCDDTYAGPRPFSEPETRLMSQFILNKQRQIKVYLSLHAYSQMFLTPWGYTYQVPPDYEDMIAVAKKAVATIESFRNTIYEVGSSTRILYAASGGSDDWVKGVAGVKFAYTVELPDRGDFGFLLPASEILPVGQETYAGIKTLVEEVARREKQGNDSNNGIFFNVSRSNSGVIGTRSETGRGFGYVSPEARSRLLRQEALRRFYARQWGRSKA